MWSLLSSRVKVYCLCSWVQFIWSICSLLLLSSQSFQEVLLHGFFGAHGWLHLKFLEPSWTAQWKRNAWIWSFTVYLRIFFSRVLFSLLRSEEDCLQLFNIRVKFVSLTVICCSVFCVLQSTWYTTNLLSEAGCWNVICECMYLRRNKCVHSLSFRRHVAEDVCVVAKVV